MTHLHRAWLAYTLLSIAVGITTSWLIAIAYAGRGVETALAAFCWGCAWVSVTPSVLRSLGRRIRAGSVS